MTDIPRDIHLVFSPPSSTCSIDWARPSSHRFCAVLPTNISFPATSCSLNRRRRRNVVRASLTHSYIASFVTFSFLLHFDVIHDLLLNRRTATWNLFFKQRTMTEVIIFADFQWKTAEWPLNHFIKARYSRQGTVGASSSVFFQLPGSQF